MLAKLESLRLVFVHLAIAIEHIARHKGAVALGELLCRPGSLKQRQRIGLSHLGIDIATIHIGNAPKDELGKKLASMVEPRIVLPHAIGNAHHTHLLIDTLLHRRPLRRIAISLSNAHQGANDSIHAAPTEQPKRTRVIIQNRLSNHARTFSLLAHIALKGNIPSKGTLNHLSRRGKRRLTGGSGIRLQLRPSLGILIAPKALNPMLRKRSILTKLPSRGIRLMGHNIPLIRATPFSPPMRIHLTERMDAIPKKVILRSRIHHSLHVKQVKIQSQMNERVHIIDFHISSNNHPSQLLGHKNSSNQNHFSQLRARQDGTPRPHRHRPGGPLEALAQRFEQR